MPIFGFGGGKQGSTTVTLTGVDKMKKDLDAIGNEVAQGKILRAALNAGAQAIKDEARLRAPVRTGELRNSIIVYRVRKPKAGTVNFIVGVKRIKLARVVKRLSRRIRKSGVKFRFKEDTFYWRFLEFGYHDRGGNFRQKMFMRPAIASVKGQLVEIVGNQIEKGIASFNKKLGAK